MADIFLSYSRKDIRFKDKVRDYLRTYGLEIWTDEGLSPGTRNWQIAIEEAIRECKGIVVILSPDSSSSVWVREELSFARNVGKPVFPLLARGDKKDAVPFGFSAAQWIDIRQNVDSGLKKLVIEFAERGWIKHTESLPRSSVQGTRRKEEIPKKKKKSIWIWIAGVFIFIAASIGLAAMTDFDADGVINLQDRCITQGDRGVGVDSKGCPYLDDDADGVRNNEDLCPDEGDYTEVDSDGCPIAYITPEPSEEDSESIPDTDEDGILDDKDRCKTEGDEGYGVDAFGCPIGPSDSDGDGYEDNEDECPNQGDHGLGVDSAGCPFTDIDNDGIKDDDDECPTQGDAGYGLEANGCPKGAPVPTEIDHTLDPTGQFLELGYWFLLDPQAIFIENGGPVNVSYIREVRRNNPCVGNVSEAPNVTVVFSDDTSDGGYIQFVYKPKNASLATIVIRHPAGGFFCSELEEVPSWGFDLFPPGEYDIWIGNITDEIQSGTLYITHDPLWFPP